MVQMPGNTNRWSGKNLLDQYNWMQGMAPKLPTNGVLPGMPIWNKQAGGGAVLQGQLQGQQQGQSVDVQGQQTQPKPTGTYTKTTTTTPASAEAGEGGANFGNATRNTLTADLLDTAGKVGGTWLGKQFQDWSGGSSKSLNEQNTKSAREMAELNNQLKKAGTFATNAMGYKGEGAQISAKNAMAGFQPDAEDVMARNKANQQADKMVSGLQGQLAANNAAQDRQAGRAVDSTIKAAKQMGGPASLGAAAAGGVNQALGESALQKNAQNAQAIQGATQAAASTRGAAAQAFNQAKDSAFQRKVQPYMNQWHEPGTESALNTGVGSSTSSQTQAGDYPIYDILGGTAKQLATRGSYQGAADTHGTDTKPPTVKTDEGKDWTIPDTKVDPDLAAQLKQQTDQDNRAGTAALDQQYMNTDFLNPGNTPPVQPRSLGVSLQRAQQPAAAGTGYMFNMPWQQQQQKKQPPRIPFRRQ